MMWGLAAGIAIPLAWSSAGIGSSPAVIENKTIFLSATRTRQRLRVAEILVTPGQRVNQGQLLVRMDTTEMDADLAIARAKQTQLELEARALEAGLVEDYARNTQRFATDAERASLEMSRLVAETERDRAELEQLELAIAREQKLVSEQLANAEYLNALLVKKAALARKVEEYQTAVTAARKGAKGTAKRLVDWENPSKKPVTSNENASIAMRIAPAQAAVETQKKEVARLKMIRDQYQLRAPMDGRVGELFLQVGQISADPELPIITVVEELTKKAVAYVDQVKAMQIQVGDIVKLTARDLTDPMRLGRVVAMAPSMTEIPLRFRKLPNVPEFTRNIYIELDSPANLPGQAFDAVFFKGTEAR
jgi:multidrug resistance efflux pump